MNTVSKYSKFNKKHTAATKEYLKRQASDPYVKRARQAGYRSRAAFKLIEIDDKFNLLRPGQVVVDLGAAPGSWTEVVIQRQRGQGRVIAIDKLEMAEIPQAIILQGDFLSNEVFDQLKTHCPPGDAGGVDVVLSDLAPETTGNLGLDHLRSMALVELAAEFARQTLKPGGAFVTKIFMGGEEKQFLASLRPHFTKVTFCKPQASRRDSKEIFIVATGFKNA